MHDKFVQTCGVGCESICVDYTEQILFCNMCSDVSAFSLPKIKYLSDNDKEKMMKARRYRMVCYGFSSLIIISLIFILSSLFFLFI